MKGGRYKLEESSPLPNYQSVTNSPRQDITPKLPQILRGRQSAIGNLGRSLDLSSSRKSEVCPRAVDSVSVGVKKQLRLRQVSPIDDVGTVGTIVKRMNFSLTGVDSSILKQKAEMYKQDFFNATLGRKDAKVTI